MRSFLIKIFIQLIALLPLRIAHGAGILFGRCFYLFPTQLRHNSKINIDLCWPELNPTQKTLLTKQSLIQAGMTLMEIGAILCWPKQRLLQTVRSFDGEELLKHSLSKGRGAIVLTPHIGCWEIAGLYISNQYPSTALYKPPKMKALATWLKAARQRTGATLVATDKSGARNLLKALTRKHEIIGMLPDQEPRAGSGVFAPFFSVKASTMTLAVKLAKKSGAPILFCFTERLPRAQGFRLFLVAADDDIYDTDINSAVAAMNRNIEQIIRKIPEQYQWSYKRFRQRPDGSRNPYAR
ncbi:MAG: hypothetical protein COC05_00865 [Gammaproteobacteria bacterium]|nr:MAG: hypothetical protein COC05_00865 [Gammaproteobacteria bacterium]